MTAQLGTDLQESLFSLDDTADDAGTPPGFRLHRLELLNWGTFHQGVRVFRLDGANSLLTGDIGSGKSTAVDAITTLLLPAHKIEYNKAAGAQKKERSLMSYVRGFHKSARSAGGEYSKPVALRGTGQLTVVLGVFHNAVLGKSVTLAITLWATQEAGQPSRFYSLAEAEQSIAADFSNFGQDPLKLKKKLRAAGASVHDSFEQYSAAFKRQFGISGNQAMELFHRTVSMKQVENITSFVRSNMLEEDDVASRISNLIHHFDDLKKAHDAVLRAKDQIALLAPIRDGAAQHARLSADDDLARAQRDQLHPWFTDRKLRLSLEHQAELERTGVRLQEDAARLNGETKQLRRDLAGVEEDIRTNGGGRLAALDADLSRLAAESAAQRKRFETYTAAAAVLGLQAPEDRVVFDANRSRLPEVEAELAGASETQQEDRTRLEIQRSELTSRAGDIAAELTSLQARNRSLSPSWTSAAGSATEPGSRTRPCRTPASCCAFATARPRGRAPRSAPCAGSPCRCWCPASTTPPSARGWTRTTCAAGWCTYGSGKPPHRKLPGQGRWRPRSPSNRARRSEISCRMSSAAGSTTTAVRTSRTSADIPGR